MIVPRFWVLSMDMASAERAMEAAIAEDGSLEVSNADALAARRMRAGLSVEFVDRTADVPDGSPYPVRRL